MVRKVIGVTKNALQTHPLWKFQPIYCNLQFETTRGKRNVRRQKKLEMDDFVANP